MGKSTYTQHTVKEADLRQLAHAARLFYKAARRQEGSLPFEEQRMEQVAIAIEAAYKVKFVVVEG